MLYPSENQGGAAPTSVTYDGRLMAQLGDFTDNFTNDESHVYLYALINPPSGANNVVINANASGQIDGLAVSFTGVDQSTPWEPLQDAVGSNDSPSIAVPSDTTQLITDFMQVQQRTATVGSGQIERHNVADGGRRICVSTELGAPSSTTMSWTLSSSQFWGIGAIALNPAPPSPVMSVDSGLLGTLEKAQMLELAVSHQQGTLTFTGEGVTLVALGSGILTLDPAALTFQSKPIELVLAVLQNEAALALDGGAIALQGNNFQLLVNPGELSLLGKDALLGAHITLPVNVASLGLARHSFGLSLTSIPGWEAEAPLEGNWTPEEELS